jgi:ATP-binding cassette subfamily C protein
MKVLGYFIRAYPGQSGIVILCMLLAGLLGGMGWSVLLPVLGVATGTGAEPDGFEAQVLSFLDLVGIPRELGPLVAVMTLAFVLKAVILLVANGRVGYTVAHVATDLRLRLVRALLAARWSHYAKLPVGVAANAMATEANRASNSFHQNALVVTHIFEAAVAAGVALAISWWATLAATAAGVLSVMALQVFVRLASRAGHRQTRLLRSLLRRMTDVLHAVKLLKATGRESLVGPLLEDDTLRLRKALRKQVLGREALRTLQEPILILFCGLGLMLAIQVLQMAAPEAFLMMLLFARTMTTLNRAQRKHQSARIEESALWSMLDMIEAAEAAAEPKTGGVAPTLERGVELRSVRFHYEEGAVFDALSLEIPARSITAILGPSGAGKTTVVDLVAGLATPVAGRVLVDGVPLSEIDLLRWRHLIGYVPQETLLLHDTVRNNTTLGDAAIPDARIEQALREAGVWEVVMRMPGGLDATVGERGTLLSGGQRQRIAIARALVREPQLLILDEATASLDAESEDAIWATVAALRGRTTVVAISHQPAVTRVADRVYRIEDGVATLVVAEKTVELGALRSTL